MSIINTDILNDLEDRRRIYELYYYIIEQIKGKKLNIDPKIFEEAIMTTDTSTIIHYIKESIQIMINKKIEEYINKNKQIYNNKYNDSIQQCLIYESQLKNLECQLRFYISKQLQYKIQRESYENKLRNFMDMEIEYENLKQKVKYDGKKFLNNDRKENEIEILRRENSNLKKAISKMEDEKKLTEAKGEINQKTIISLKNQIEKLNKKLYNVGQELSKLKENTNSKINININNTKSSSNYIINQNFEAPKRNKINLKSHNSSLTYNNEKPIKNNKYVNKTSSKKNLKKNFPSNPYNKIINCLSNRTTITTSKKPKRHHRNNSMNNIEEIKKTEIVNKYFTHRQNSNYKNYNNYFKQFSSAIPSTKISITKDKNKSKNSSLSTMYINNTKISRSGNRSTINIKSTSNDNI